MNPVENSFAGLTSAQLEIHAGGKGSAGQPTKTVLEKIDQAKKSAAFHATKKGSDHAECAGHYNKAIASYLRGDEAQGNKHLSTAKKQTAKLKDRMEAATHEHHAGEFASRDRTISELKKNGFKDDSNNFTHNAPDHRPKFFHKSVTNDEKTTAMHTVMVKPDGSFEHSAELSNRGEGADAIKHISKLFGSSSKAKRFVGANSSVLGQLISRLIRAGWPA